MECVAVSIRLLLQFHSDDPFSKNYARRIPHLPRINASNHSRRAVSSLTREEMGIILAIGVKVGCQFAFRVPVGCSSGEVKWRRRR